MKKTTLLVFLSLNIAMSYAQLAPGDVLQSFKEKGFLENKGQVKDANEKTNNHVKFLYNNGAFNLALKEDGFSYELAQVVTDNGSMDEAGYAQESRDENDPIPVRVAATSRIDVSLEGANSKATIIASDPTGAYFNFYYSPVSTNRIEHVNAYNTITYRNIYAGIDLVFHAPDAEAGTPLQYDFIVHPGADPNVIQLKYNGASDLQLNSNGSLHLNTRVGYVEEGTPFSFLQATNSNVATVYSVVKNRVKFNVEQYDRNQTLVIDPTLIWGTYFGGENVDDVAHIAIDSKDKVIIDGSTTSTTHIASTGAYQTTYGGNPSDLYVAKFKINGKLDWASYFGGNRQDLAYGVNTDNQDNVILTGKSKSDGLATIGPNLVNGYGDAIIVKFSPTGTFQWSTYRGGGGDDHFRNCIADGQGNLYFAGYSLSPSNVVTANAFQPIYGGNGDCMIAKYTPAGNVIWCTYYGAKGQDRLHAINLDLYGHLLVQGTTGSDSGVATTGAHQQIYGGGDEDVLLAEFDTAGHRIWCTYYGGEYSDRGRGVQSDSAGNIYIGGLTESSTGIATPNAHQTQWTEGYYDGGSRAEDGYLAKFTPDGHQLIWGTYYGGTGYDRIWGITIDRKSHNIYAVGGTSSPTNIATSGAWQSVISVGPWGEGFFSKWDYDNNLIWGSYLGETSEDHLEDVEQDSQEFLYVLGQTDKSLMPVTLGVQQMSSNGMDDAFLYKFYPGLTCYDYNEPNEKINTAKLVTAWTPADSLVYGINGSIANKNDQDWFRLKMKANQPNLQVILSDLTKDYNLKFYNSQKVLLQSSLNTGTTNDTITANNLAAGSYYIVIAHTATQFDSLNCYRLTTLKSSSVFFAPQNTNKFTETTGAMMELKVFPNPAADNLSFSISATSEGNASMLIFDMLGRIVKTGNLSLDEGFQTLEIPVTNLPAGMYKLVLKSNEKSWVANFVKQ